MPVIREISVKPDVSEVLRQAGITEESEFRPKMKSLIADLLSSGEADSLLAPAIAYESHSITEIQNERLCLDRAVVFEGYLLPSTLAQASDLAVIFCTIGPYLEEEKAECKAKKDLMRALLLDSYGSAAIDLLAIEAYHLIKKIAASQGHAASSPIIPGVPGFSISEQWHMAQLAPIEEIGLQLTSSGMMRPQKSLSMVIGFGPNMPTWTRAEACARCNMAKSCRYRASTHSV
jgi:hypothetical protein